MQLLRGQWRSPSSEEFSDLLAYQFVSSIAHSVSKLDLPFGAGIISKEQIDAALRRRKSQGQEVDDSGSMLVDTSSNVGIQNI
jgi:hypothetical protein